ncbi:hypothetical protein D9756_008611 [Leucocoprinus leucothites]|uniref:C2 NT-type domain-containing protein n=1 Tax=Leucocoprinus leucothites TaxID=201217 RepID=A0A8H5CZ51_9AGAR|nr:hypothetical protein D9756_008611 [Leucoagaricus leucothites]
MPPPAALSLRPRLSAANLHSAHSNSSAQLDPHPTTPATPHGFRAQINQLIPRHSYFRARVTIHQIDSVPFVSGQFAVRWKFKQVHSPPGVTRSGGLLGIVKTRSKNGDRRAQAVIDATSTTTVTTTSTVSSSSSSSSSSDPSLPSVIVSTNSTDSSRSSSISTTRLSDSTNDASRGASSTTLHIHAPTARVCAPSPTSTPLLPSFSTSTTTTASIASSTADLMTTPARGTTLYTPLKDHSVHWNQTLSTVVRLDVDRDNGYIFPCPFKLVVMQRPNNNDDPDERPESPQEHRLGAVYLNLSEYVGHGPVERRYLLRESRTNATLKLTIELDFISGQASYIPPPLPKGEILNGLSGYLEGELSRSALPSATINTSTSASGSRPSSSGGRHSTTHGIELYGPYSNQEELEMDLFGTTCPKRKKSSKSLGLLNRSRSKLALSSTPDVANLAIGGGADSEGDSDYEFMEYPHHHPHSSMDEPTITITTHLASPPPPHSPDTTTPTPIAMGPTFFDVERLPMAYGTKTTETLIEAIFNPVRISEERCESPFTVYVPTPPRPSLVPVSGQQPPKSSPAAPMRRVEGEGVAQPPHTSSLERRRRRKPVPNIEVASVCSTSSIGTCTSNSTSNTNSSSASASGSGSGSGHSVQDSKTGVVVNANGAGGGGGRVKDWWKRNVGREASRPGTPTGVKA